MKIARSIMAFVEAFGPYAEKCAAAGANDARRPDRT